MIIPEEEEITVNPPEVDFDALKAINDDVVGWLELEAIPSISYPITQERTMSIICTGRSNRPIILRDRSLLILRMHRVFLTVIRSSTVII